MMAMYSETGKHTFLKEVGLHVCRMKKVLIKTDTIHLEKCCFNLFLNNMMCFIVLDTECPV